ncbi:ankyrin and armadillo repeat-containing protein-like [Cyprinus carpio]|uniref:Ankyrin and armadillo repeat-containing protein-like n=1 Tax=Cyprinus carpio TaxID=7962 RepID=A0A9R0B2W4_CYPCA|nr:ankyrin and armadillo repeat-containing protein-like [Cyprinus carpio]
MAEQMGYPVILDLLQSSSDKMQYAGGRSSQDSCAHQDGFCRENGVPPLVHLLRGSQTALKTLLSVIKALGCLCIGVALTTCREKVILELLKSHESLEVKASIRFKN